MAKKNFYGVKLTNGKSDIFTSWDEAKDFIATCPAKAQYKGFGTREDAESFIGGRATAQEKAVLTISTEAVAFVDGSFNASTNTWGAAAVLYPTQDPDHAITLMQSGTIHAEQRNVKGETIAALLAVRNAIQEDYASVTVVYDYEGIENWALGTWKRNNDMSKSYHTEMTEYMKHIDVKFLHVDGHTGIKGNESVDKLAKQACGI